MNDERIVMVGPHRSVRGGMTSVATHILDHAPAGWTVELVGAYVDGRPWSKVAAFAVGYARVAGLLRGARGLHIHMSQRADVLRAIAFIDLARRRGVPTLVHAHASEFRRWFDALPEPRRRWIAGRLRRMTRMAVLSNGWRTYYHDALGVPLERIDVLPNPVRIPDEPARGLDDGRVQAVFLGRIGERKGAFALIDAVGRLPPNALAGLHVVMAGDGATEQARRRVAEAGLEGTVRVLDWIEPDERDALIAASDVFVLPSRDEGLPMALLEAMGAGLAPVTTPVGGIPEVVRDGENGLLVAPDDPAGLARALARLLSDAPLRRSLGRRAREDARAFGAEPYAARLADLYDRLEVGG